MPRKQLSRYHLILASKSPRRQFLLKKIGFKFEIRTKETDESFPKKLKGKQIALYLCKKKALAFKNELKPNDLLITADTIVWIHNRVLNKPAGHTDAVKMLKLLSGKTHTVYTGVCLTTSVAANCFVVSTKVRFKRLTEDEIRIYVTHYKPFDKAGSYGAQECLPPGMNPCSTDEIKFLKRLKKTKLIKSSINTRADAGKMGIVKKITGSYFNVMGLPVMELYQELIKL